MDLEEVESLGLPELAPLVQNEILRNQGQDRLRPLHVQQRHGYHAREWIACQCR